MRDLNFTFNESSLMTKILYKPLFNILMLFYVYLPGQDFGIAIIALTLLIRLILFPSYVKTLKSQQALKKIQPKIDEIRALHKEDQAKQSKELMRVYAENKVNPLSSCLPLLIQLPILFALYRVFTFGLNIESLNYLYAWFPNVPETINTTFLAFTGVPSLMVDLASPSLFLAIMAGVVQLIQSWMMSRMQPMPTAGGGMTKMITNQMMYFFPFITVFIAMSLPAALALYWVATTFFMVLQQAIVMSSFKKTDEKTDSKIASFKKEDKTEAIEGVIEEEENKRADNLDKKESENNE